MSYTIYFDKWDNTNEEYTNLTLNKLCNDDEAIVKTEVFEYWFNNTYSKNCDKLEDFKQSNTFLELQDSYTPIYNYVHILSTFVDDDKIKIISKYVSNTVIIHLNYEDVNVIALTSYGMDFSDSIELAYYIADGKSPVISNHVISLDKNTEKLLYFCRNKTKEEGAVSMYDIEKFIDNGYQVEEEK